eukprot:365955-Chlamydomonas_euryale.AAC.4
MGKDCVDHAIARRISIKASMMISLEGGERTMGIGRWGKGGMGGKVWVWGRWGLGATVRKERNCKGRAQRIKAGVH